MREANVERACVAHAAMRGVPSFKLQGGITGDPDRVFLLRHMPAWLVEFKTARGDLSPRQKYRHEELRRQGHPVSVIRSTAIFKVLLDVYLQATP